MARAGFQVAKMTSATASADVTKDVVAPMYFAYELATMAEICRALGLAKRIAILPERLIHYRRNNAGSQYANLSKWPLSCCEALEKLQAELRQRNLYGKYKAAFVRRTVRYCLFYLDEIHRFFNFQDNFLSSRNHADAGRSQATGCKFERNTHFFSFFCCFMG